MMKLLCFVLVFLCILVYIGTCASDVDSPIASDQCISSYRQLKTSLRSSNSNNVYKMINAFYPPNKSTTHVVFVHYCIKKNATTPNEEIEDDDNSDDELTFSFCNDTIAKYEYQWLSNSLSILSDSDVLEANTFYLASLNRKNLSLIIDPLCDDVDVLPLLETLTVWLKSYAIGDDETIKSYSTFLNTNNLNRSSADTAYSLLFASNGTRVTVIQDLLFEINVKKLIIGMWLGVVSLIVSLVIHLGMQSARTSRIAEGMVEVYGNIHYAYKEIPTLKQLIAILLSKIRDNKKKPEASSTENRNNQDDSNSNPDNNPADDVEAGWTKVEKSNLAGEICEICKNKNCVKLTNLTTTLHNKLRTFSPIVWVVLVALTVYNVLMYFWQARKLSYDWFILYPFPFWFLVQLIFSIVVFIVTKLWAVRKNCFKQRQSIADVWRIKTRVDEVLIEGTVMIGASMLPLFIIFHLFWIGIASLAFAIRIVSSGVFYVPLMIFLIWLYFVIYLFVKEIKKMIASKKVLKSKEESIKEKEKMRSTIRSMITIMLFIPFWILFLATVNVLSDFINEVVQINSYSSLAIIGLFITIIAIAKGIAECCSFNTDDNDTDADDAKQDNSKPKEMKRNVNRASLIHGSDDGSLNEETEMYEQETEKLLID